MAKRKQSWIKFCLNTVLVVTFIQIFNISGTYSQKVDSQTGPIILNIKEPPDLLNNANLQNTVQIVNNRNKKPKNMSVNQRTMKFLCNRRLPVVMSRRKIPPQTTTSPFILTAVPEVTETNRILHVKIDSHTNKTFRGLMIQVLSAEPGADDKVLGQFISSPNVNLQTCHSVNDTVTSADWSRLTSVNVTWKAPADMEERSVIVRATIVQNYRTYWIDLTTDKIIFEETNISSTKPNDDVIVNNGKKTNTTDLEKSIAETFEGFDGPFESADEVLLHQGITKVDKLGRKNDNVPETRDEPGVIILPPKIDEAPTAPLPPPRYIYRTMNQFAPNFEPPSTSEFVGQLLGNMLTGGNRQASSAGGGGGLGSMMNMMGMASKMFGGGNQGGGGGLMSSLGTMSKLGGMLGGMSGGGGGSLGGLGALSSMLGGGGGSPLGRARGGGNANVPLPAPPPANRGGGGIGGALSSLLGGFGNKNSAENVAPMPVGGPVNPNRKNEPSLADLLGVDPSIGMGNTPTVIPAEANPVAGVSAAKAGGGMLAKLGGFAPMLAMAPIAFTLLGSKKKKQQQMPFGAGQPGQFGMPGGSPGQFGMPPGQGGQFGMAPGQRGQFGMPPGQGGQFGMAPGQQGQFAGAPGQFGRPPQGFGFGPTQAPAWPPTTAPSSSSDKDIQQIIQLLEAQRLQIEALKAQIGGASITSQMGGFGNIPLSFGQKTNAQLLGLSGQNGLSSGLGGIGSTLSTFEPAGPPKVEQKPKSSSSNDLLLQQLLQQNQMLMQQNQQFQTNMLNAAQGQGQFGATSGNTFNRVNRSNGQMPINNGVNDMLGQNNGQSSLLQNQNNAGNGFPNSAQLGPGNVGVGASNNAFGNQDTNSWNFGIGGGGQSRPQTGSPSMFGQFGGSQQGSPGGTVPTSVSNNANAAGGLLNQGNTGGGNSLANMFGGGGGGGGASGGGGLGGLMGNMLGGGGGGDGGGGGGGLGSLMGNMLGGGGADGGGSQSNPLASLMGGGGGGGPDIGSLMGNMLGGGGNSGGGGMDMSKILGNVDMNAMQGMLSGEQGQDLMKSVSGMLSGPAGGDLMKAMEGMMSGNGNPADIMGLMGKMDMNELQSMAKQAEGLMASSGIDPAQILGMMGK